MFSSGFESPVKGQRRKAMETKYLEAAYAPTTLSSREGAAPKGNGDHRHDKGEERREWSREGAAPKGNGD